SREYWTGYQRGDYLNICDNDLFFKPLEPYWMETLVKCYEAVWDDGFRVVGAYGHPFHVPGRDFRGGNGYSVNEVNAVATQSMFLRWEVFEKYGPFCKTPVDKVCQSEDVDLTNK